MFKSEIFDEYAKAMMAAGFDKKAQTDSSTEKKDKVDLKDIQNLYNIKQEDQEEDKTIIEIAHPETAIAGRAYDAMNAVIENEHQRQDVMTWIALKMPDGHLTHQRYVKSKSDLMNSLVQVAFTADSQNNEEIMKMADTCASELHKQALAPLAVLGFAGVALGLGYLGWAMYGGVSVQNVYSNAKLLLDQVQDVSDKPYASYIAKTAEKLMKDAADFNDIRTRSLSKNLTSVEDLIEKTTEKQSQQDIQRLDSIEKIWDAFLQLYPRYVEAINISMSQGSQEESSDWWQKLKNIGETFIPALNDEKQVLDYLEGLKDAVLQAKQQAQQVKSLGQQKAVQLKPQIEEKLKTEKKPSFPNLEDLVTELQDQVPQ